MTRDLYYDFSEAYTRSGEWQLVHCPVLVNSNERDPLYQDITFYFIIRNGTIMTLLFRALMELNVYILTPCQWQGKFLSDGKVAKSSIYSLFQCAKSPDVNHFSTLSIYSFPASWFHHWPYSRFFFQVRQIKKFKCQFRFCLASPSTCFCWQSEHLKHHLRFRWFRVFLCLQWSPLHAQLFHRVSRFVRQFTVSALTVLHKTRLLSRLNC